MRREPIANHASDEDARVFLRLPSVVRMTGLARSTIYKLRAQHQFPAPVHLGGRAVGWRRVDIERWSADRPSLRC